MQPQIQQPTNNSPFQTNKFVKKQGIISKRSLPSIYFKSRKTSKLGATIQVFISLNSVETTPFSIGLKHYPNTFNNSNQSFTSKHKDYLQDNATITRIRQEIKSLFDEMARKKAVLTAITLKQEYLKEPQIIPSFFQCFDTMIAKDKNIAEGTLKNYRYFKTSFLEYLQTKHKISDIELYQIDLEFLEKYVQFNQEKGDTAGTIKVKVSKIHKVLQYAIKYGYINHNPTKLIEKEPATENEIFHVFDENLEKIENINFRYQRLEDARIRFIIQCYTGLGFAELDMITKENIYDSPDGLYIKIIRKKSRRFKRNSIIPLLPKVEKILENCNYKIPYICASEYNTLLKCIAEFIGHPEPDKFKSHIGRKTAATMFLNSDVEIKSVSTILGHSSVLTTEKFYATVLPSKVLKDTKHLRTSK